MQKTAAPDCQTGQNKGRYREQERSFLLVSLLIGLTQQNSNVLDLMQQPIRAEYLGYWRTFSHCSFVVRVQKGIRTRDIMFLT